MTCRTCKYFDPGLPDADGKIRLRRHQTYRCTVPFDLEKIMPASISRWNWQSLKPGRVTPDEGEGCPTYEQKPLRLTVVAKED